MTAFGYDPASGRLLTKTAYASAAAYASNAPNGEGVSFTYYADGTRRTATRTAASGMVTTTYAYYGYDAGGATVLDFRQGRLKSVTNNVGTLTYDYDAAGNKTGMQSPSMGNGHIAYSYDALNRLSTVTHTDGATTTFAYDNAGNRQSVTRKNAAGNTFSTTSYVYDTLNRLTNLANKDSAGNVVSNYLYTLRADGKRSNVVESGSGTSNSQTIYTYDDSGKLTQESGAYGMVAYGYDNVGNRRTRTVSGSTTAALVNGQTVSTYDANDRITSQSGPTGNVVHTYDADGNETTVNGQAASYDFENHLIGLSGGTSYTYDADGNRVGVTTSGVTTSYLVDTSLPYASVVEEYSASTLSARYDYGDDLVRMDRGSGVYYYLYDGLGSTRQLVNTGGSVTDGYSYDAFGEGLSHTGNTVNPFLFNAQQFDAASGDYYLRARYYDPSNGRFLSQDPFAGNNEDPISLHRYLYAANDPVDGVDSGGQDENLVSAATTNTFAQTLTGLVSSAIVRIGALAATNIRVFYAIQTVNALASVFMASQDPDQGVLYLTTDGFAADFELLYTGGAALYRGIIADTERILAYDVARGASSGTVNWGIGDSSALSRRMENAGIPKPSYPVAAHHIIPGNADRIPEIQRAKAKLTSFGISANDAANGVYLPSTVSNPIDYTNGTPHIGSHNDDYYKLVGEYISGAASKEEAITRLQTVGQLLKSGKIRLNKY